MARKIVDRHLKNIDSVFLCLDEIFYKRATTQCFMNMPHSAASYRRTEETQSPFVALVLPASSQGKWLCCKGIWPRRRSIGTQGGATGSGTGVGGSGSVGVTSSSGTGSCGSGSFGFTFNSHPGAGGNGFRSVGGQP